MRLRKIALMREGGSAQEPLHPSQARMTTAKQLLPALLRGGGMKIHFQIKTAPPDMFCCPASLPCRPASERQRLHFSAGVLPQFRQNGLTFGILHILYDGPGMQELLFRKEIAGFSGKGGGGMPGEKAESQGVVPATGRKILPCVLKRKVFRQGNSEGQGCGVERIVRYMPSQCRFLFTRFRLSSGRAFFYRRRGAGFQEEREFL